MLRSEYQHQSTILLTIYSLYKTYLRSFSYIYIYFRCRCMNNLWRIWYVIILYIQVKLYKQRTLMHCHLNTWWSDDLWKNCSYVWKPKHAWFLSIAIMSGIWLNNLIMSKWYSRSGLFKWFCGYCNKQNSIANWGKMGNFGTFAFFVNTQKVCFIYLYIYRFIVSFGWWGFYFVIFPINTIISNNICFQQYRFSLRRRNKIKQ